MEIFANIFRGAAIALALATVSACTATKPLPAGFYQSVGAPAAKLPIRVAVVSEGLPKEVFRGDGTLVAGKITLASYPGEVAAMLRDIYSSVTVVPAASAVTDVDMRVHLGAEYPAQLLLDFRDPASGEQLGWARAPGLASANTGPIKMGFAVPYNIFFIPVTLGIVGLVELGMANGQANRLSNDIQRTSNLGLQSLRRSILTVDDLIMSPAKKRELQAHEAQGDAAQASSDPIGALLSYQQALALLLPGSRRALALQAKIVPVAVQMGELPPVPVAAQDLMTRGLAAMSMARSPKDLGRAGEDMEKALVQAPWWAAGHLNTALVQEGAGQWSNAAAHLQMHLQLEPQSADRDKLRLKMAELQLRHERGDKPVGAE